MRLSVTILVLSFCLSCIASAFELNNLTNVLSGRSIIFKNDVPLQAGTRIVNFKDGKVSEDPLYIGSCNVFLKRATTVKSILAPREAVINGAVSSPRGYVDQKIRRNVVSVDIEVRDPSLKMIRCFWDKDQVGDRYLNVNDISDLLSSSGFELKSDVPRI